MDSPSKEGPGFQVLGEPNSRNGRGAVHGGRGDLWSGNLITVSGGYISSKFPWFNAGMTPV